MDPSGERHRWLLVLMLGSVAAMACFEASDGDLGFHLATGREILATGRIPSTNVLSFAEPDHTWLLHQALPAVLFEWLWQRFGIVGVIASKMVVVTATWAVVYATARTLRSSVVCAVASCLVAACASAFRFEVRPYLFTHFTLALTLLAIATYVRSREVGAVTWHRHAALLSAGASLMVGSQLHAGAVDSALVMLLFACGVAFEAWRARLWKLQPMQPNGGRAAVHWLLAAVLGTAGAACGLALYHPLGARVLAFPFAMAEHRYWGEHLVEFRHAWTFPFSTLVAYWFWLATAVLVLWSARRRLHLGFWALALAYAVISLIYVRMVYAFALIAAPLVASSLTPWLENWLQRVPGQVRGRTTGVVACCALFAGCAPLYVYRDHTPGFGLAASAWPLAHFDFIRAHQLNGRAFVSDAWAGSFLGTFYPQRKVFFDDRLEAYSDEFARNTYQRIRYGAPGWDALLERYQIAIVLLRYTTPGEGRLQRGAPNLRQRLAADPRYSLVYFDDTGELFVRSTPDNAALIASYGLAGVDPDRRQFLVQPARCVNALLRAGQRGERSITLLGLSALALADAGDKAHADILLQTAMRDAPDDAWLTRVHEQLAARNPR